MFGLSNERLAQLSRRIAGELTQRHGNSWRVRRLVWFWNRSARQHERLARREAKS